MSSWLRQIKVCPKRERAQWWETKIDTVRTFAALGHTFCFWTNPIDVFGNGQKPRWWILLLAEVWCIRDETVNGNTQKRKSFSEQPLKCDFHRIVEPVSEPFHDFRSIQSCRRLSIWSVGVSESCFQCNQYSTIVNRLVNLFVTRGFSLSLLIFFSYCLYLGMDLFVLARCRI